MATQLQIRRGTSSQVAAFTGAEGEIVVNTTNDSVHVNDGSTAGGFELARVDGSNWAITNDITTTSNIDVGTVTADGLTVDGASLLSGAATAGFVTPLTAKNPSTNAASSVKIALDAGGTTWGEIGASYNSNNPYMAFFVRSGSEKLRITDAGNVGISATPKTWFTTYDTTALQLSSSGTIWTLATSDSDRRIAISNNMYVNASGSAAYTNNGPATQLIQEGGVFKFQYKASGTADSAFVFDEAMRIDSAGRVGIGTSNAQAKLDVSGVGNFSTGYNTFTGDGLHIQCSGTGGNGNYTGGISFSRISADNNSRAAGIAGVQGADADQVGLAFFTHSSATTTASLVEAMRIDSSGNVGIGNSSGVGKLEVFANNTAPAAYIRQDGTGPIQSWHIAAGAEKMRLTSGGDLLVGTTTSFGLLSVRDASGSSVSVTARFLGGASNDSLLIRGDGDAENTNNSYGAISDVRVKENIVDASPKLADLMRVQVRNYNLIGTTHKQIGVVAQELEQVFPGMIKESPEIDTNGQETGETRKSVKYSVFVPMLIKAMQEQQETITALETRITQLENN